MMAEPVTSEQVKQKALDLGFHKVGIVAVPPLSSSTAQEQGLQQWLAQGYQAEMAWMSDPRRQEIRQLMPQVQSIICLGINYYTPQPHPQGDQYAKISRYGWGRDYHRVLQRRLKALATWLRGRQPQLQAHYYADTGPVQDKLWAERAGLGWIGKHSNLITRDYGSWLFLGEVLTDAQLTPDRPHTQHCGTCTRCIQACPTQAIAAPFVVDANRCIAYHTIENRDPSLPAEIASALDGWVAGCDICQDVCPWNQRFAQETDIPDFQPYPWHLQTKLTDLVDLTEEERDRRFPASALKRITLAMLQRNAKAALKSAQDPGQNP